MKLNYGKCFCCRCKGSSYALANSSKDVSKATRKCVDGCTSAAFSFLVRACVCSSLLPYRDDDALSSRATMRYARMRRNINDYDFTHGDILDGWMRYETHRES